MPRWRELHAAAARRRPAAVAAPLPPFGDGRRGMPVLATVRRLTRRGDGPRCARCCRAAVRRAIRGADGVAFSDAVADQQRAMAAPSPIPARTCPARTSRAKLLIVLREAGSSIERAQPRVEPLVPAGCASERSGGLRARCRSSTTRGACAPATPRERARLVFVAEYDGARARRSAGAAVRRHARDAAPRREPRRARDRRARRRAARDLRSAGAPEVTGRTLVGPARRRARRVGRATTRRRREPRRERVMPGRGRRDPRRCGRLRRERRAAPCASSRSTSGSSPCCAADMSAVQPWCCAASGGAPNSKQHAAGPTLRAAAALCSGCTRIGCRRPRPDRRPRRSARRSTGARRTREVQRREAVPDRAGENGSAARGRDARAVAPSDGTSNTSSSGNAARMASATSALPRM